MQNIRERQETRLASIVRSNRLARSWPILDRLAKQAPDQFYRGARGTAPLVEKRIKLNNIDRPNQSGIMQHLHHQMRLAIGGAAGNGGADAGRQAGIEKIDVETDVQHAVAGFHLVDDPADQHPNPELVDLAHIGTAAAAY